MFSPPRELNLKEKRGLVLAKNRAEVQLRRKDLSIKERRQFKKIAGMNIPAKDNNEDEEILKLILDPKTNEIINKYFKNPYCVIGGKATPQGGCMDATEDLVNHFVELGISKDRMKIHTIKINDNLKSFKDTKNHVILEVDGYFFDPTNRQFEAVWKFYDIPKYEIERGVYRKLPKIYEEIENNLEVDNFIRRG